MTSYMDKILAHYEFKNGENDFSDSSCNHFDGVIGGTNPPTIQEIEGRKCAVFEGGDHGTNFIKLPENLLSDVSDNTGFTVSTWVYYKKGGNTWERIFDFGKSQNGVDILGKINAHTVFKKPSFDIILKSGIIVATCGTIIASNSIPNSLSFALSWYNSKPYPANEQINKHTTVWTIAYKNEFPIAPHRSCPSRSFVRFSIAFVPKTIFPLATSTVSLVAAVIIQYSGNTEINDTIIRKI